MGNKHSKLERQNPVHIFTTPAEVRSQLLQALHREPEPYLNRLRAVFEARACDADTGTNCPPYWTKETFIDYVVSRNADAGLQVRNVGPLLYKMVVHYGSHPFPPSRDTKMTGEVFLLGVSMLSRLNWNLFWRDYGTVGEELRNRNRRPVDDVRILFQSIASSTLGTVVLGDERSVRDDEDLLDVLFVAMETKRRERQSLVGYERRHFVPTSRQLPSSCSRDLDGWIGVGELKGLFELVVVLSMRRCVEGTVGVEAGEIVECLTSSFFAHTNETEKVTWDTFKNVVLHSFPNLLRFLFGFFEHTFEMTPRFWHERDLLPRAPHVHDILFISKVLTHERICQLLLALPGALTLHFKDIEFQDTPSFNHDDTITTLLSRPGRLLLVKGTNFIASPTTNGPSILAIYTGTSTELFSGHGLMPGAWRNGAIVTCLAPIHAVFHAPRKEDDDTALNIQSQDDGISLNIGDVELNLIQGLGVLSLKTKAFSTKVTVEMIEVWSM